MQPQSLEYIHKIDFNAKVRRFYHLDCTLAKSLNVSMHTIMDYVTFVKKLEPLVHKYNKYLLNCHLVALAINVEHSMWYITFLYSSTQWDTG